MKLRLVKLRLLLGLTIAGVAVAAYRIATIQPPQPAQSETMVQPQGAAPRLAKESVAILAEEDSEPSDKEEEHDGSDEQTPSLHQLPISQLLDLAVHAAKAWMRADALEELAARRSNDALPALLDRLTDPSSEVRRVAADGLAELGNESALSALERALPAEHVAKTRLAMAMAIAELHQEPSEGIQ